MKSYLGSQEHFEDEINSNYDNRAAQDKEQVDIIVQEQPNDNFIKAETAKAEIVFVTIPNDVLGYAHNTETGSFCVSTKDEFYELCMVESGFSLQGRLMLIRESEAIKLVESVKVDGWDSPAYRNYRKHISSSKDCFMCPDNSLHSLAESLGVKNINTVVLFKIK